MKIKATYSVPENCVSSGDLHNADGTFIRNLWNFEPLVANQVYKKDIDDRNALPAGSNYKVKVTTNKIKSVCEGIIGNTSSAKTGPTKFNSMEQAKDLDVGINDYFYCTGYNEVKSSCHRIPKSNIQSTIPVFAQEGINAMHVCVNNGIVYWAGVDPWKFKSYATEFTERFIDKKLTIKEACKDFPSFTESKVRVGGYVTLDSAGRFLAYKKPELTRAGFTTWFNTYVVNDAWFKTFSGIWGTKESDNSEVTFLNGLPYQARNGRKYKSMIQYSGPNADVTGLAVSNDCIYLAFGGIDWGFNSANLIRVYNKEGLLLNEFAAEAPRKMIVVGDCLFYCSKNGLIKAVIDAAGTITPVVEWRFPNPWTTLDVSYSKVTDLVSLASSDGSIRYFDKDLVEKLVKGSALQYWDNPAITNDKFYWEDNKKQYECFICTDENGQQFIGDGGNQRIQVYDKEFVYKTTISWLSTLYHVGSLGNRIFAGYLEFERDMASTTLKWKLKRNWSYYVDGNFDDKYVMLEMPFDLNGKTYAKMESLVAAQIMLVELDPAFGLRSLNKVNTSAKERTFIYPDGCIYKDESAANIKITKQKYVGTNTDGTFKWYNPVVVVNSDPKTANETQNHSSKRIFETYGEKLFVYNATKEEREFHLTSVNMTTGKFIRNGFPSTHLAYQGDYRNDLFAIGDGVIYAGGQYVVVDGFIWCNYHGENWAAGQVNKWHIFDENLVALHTYGQDGKTIRKQAIVNPAAMMAGNSFSGNVSKIGNYYYLYHNDEGQHGGVHAVRFENVAVKRYDFAAQVYQPAIYPDTVYPLELLPRTGNLTSGVAGWTMEPAAGYSNTNDIFIVSAGKRHYPLIGSSDLYVYFRSPAKRCVVSYPLNPATALKWNLHGLVNFEGNTHTRDLGKTSSCRLQIVDAADKVIAEFWPSINYTTKIVTLYINNVAVWIKPEVEAEKILDYFQTIDVWCLNGILTAKYGNSSIITLGPTTLKPAKFRVLIYNTTTTTFHQQVSLIDLKFNKR